MCYKAFRPFWEQGCVKFLFNVSKELEGEFTGVNNRLPIKIFYIKQFTGSTSQQWLRWRLYLIKNLCLWRRGYLAHRPANPGCAAGDSAEYECGHCALPCIAGKRGDNRCYAHHTLLCQRAYSFQLCTHRQLCRYRDSR